MADEKVNNNLVQRLIFLQVSSGIGDCLLFIWMTGLANGISIQKSLAFSAES